MTTADSAETAQSVDELEIIASDPSEPFELSTGDSVRVLRLKTRETLALLRILTRGAGDVLAQTQFSTDMDTTEFVGVFVTSVILSIPEAEDETVDFVRRMVVPADLIDAPVSRAEVEANNQKIAELYAKLGNPDLDDSIDIIERVIRIEAPHILALGKRLASLLAAQRPAKKATKSRKTSSTSSTTSAAA